MYILTFVYSPHWQWYPHKTRMQLTIHHINMRATRINQRAVFSSSWQTEKSLMLSTKQAKQSWALNRHEQRISNWFWHQSDWRGERGRGREREKERERGWQKAWRLPLQPLSSWWQTERSLLNAKCFRDLIRHKHQSNSQSWKFRRQILVCFITELSIDYQF